jgi:hypothetical protein
MYRQADRFSPFCIYVLYAGMHENVILLFISDIPVRSVLGMVK